MGKRGKAYYKGTAKKFKSSQMQVGLVGFLCTFVRGKDRLAKSELFELLNSYSSDLDANSDQTSSDSDSDDACEGLDIDAALKQQVSKLKQKRLDEKFKSYDTGVNHVLFFSTTSMPSAELDHQAVCYKLLEDARIGEKRCSTRSLLRLLPVLNTCRASHDNITTSIHQAINSFLASNYNSNTEGLTYKIEAKVRNNTDSDLSSTKLIRLAGSVISEGFPMWKVNLQSPDVHIFIDILKTIAYISVVQDYIKYKKFNLQELAVSHAQTASTPASAGSATPELEKSSLTDNKASPSLASATSADASTPPTEVTRSDSPDTDGHVNLQVQSGSVDCGGGT